MNIEQIRGLLDHVGCHILGHRFLIRIDRDCKHPILGRPFLQIIYQAQCNKTGMDEIWHGRKWYLSEHMTEDEVVKTAYAAFEAAVKHEVMEGFTFDGKAVFNPHIDFRELLRISDREVKREPLRENPAKVEEVNQRLKQ